MSITEKRTRQPELKVSEETSLNLGRKSRADEQERGQLKKKGFLNLKTTSPLAFFGIKKLKTIVHAWFPLILCWK